MTYPTKTENKSTPNTKKITTTKTEKDPKEEDLTIDTLLDPELTKLNKELSEKMEEEEET